MMRDPRPEDISQWASLQKVKWKGTHCLCIWERTLSPQIAQLGNRVQWFFLVSNHCHEFLKIDIWIFQQSHSKNFILFNERNNSFAEVFRDVLCIIFRFDNLSISFSASFFQISKFRIAGLDTFRFDCVIFTFFDFGAFVIAILLIFLLQFQIECNLLDEILFNISFQQVQINERVHRSY